MCSVILVKKNNKKKTEGANCLRVAGGIHTLSSAIQILKKCHFTAHLKV